MRKRRWRRKERSKRGRRTRGSRIGVEMRKFHFKKEEPAAAKVQMRRCRCQMMR